MPTPRPGQIPLWWPDPTGRRPKSLRIVTADAVSEAIRDLPTASARAGAAAERTGEAWLLADDLTVAHVDAAGDVTPSTGWAALASRVIQRRNP